MKSGSDVRINVGSLSLPEGGGGGTESVSLASEAAAQSNASSLAQMKREIAELEAQVLKGGSRATVKLVGWDITELPPTAQFSLCAAGVLICYLSVGVLQEGLIRHDLDNELAWFLTFAQFLLYLIFAEVQRIKRGAERRKTPFSYYAILGLLQVATMGFSNLCVQYLNYPTQILFKSSKAVPTILFGALYHGRRYSPSDFIAISLMMLGMAIFCVTDAATFKHFHPNGIAMVVIAIVADAVSSAVQEKIVTQYKAASDEVVLYTHLTGMIYLLIICVGSSEMGEGLAFTFERPHVFAKIFAFSLAGYLGASSLKALNTASGPLPTLLTTTCRKAMGLALSVAFYPKPFGGIYVIGAFIFFGGTLLQSSAVKVRLRAVLGGNSVFGKLLQAEPRRRRAVRQMK